MKVLNFNITRIEFYNIYIERNILYFVEFPTLKLYTSVDDFLSCFTATHKH